MRKKTFLIAVGMAGAIIVSISVSQAAAQTVIPTIHSVPAGGSWDAITTWAGDRLPAEGDVVEINGSVQLSGSIAVSGLLISPGAELANHVSSDAVLTVNGDAENNGLVQNQGCGHRLTLNISGNIVNNGDWNNYQTILTTAKNRTITGSVPINGKIIMGGILVLPTAPLSAEYLILMDKL